VAKDAAATATARTDLIFMANHSFIAVEEQANMARFGIAQW
jgi:hypothetical protein